MPHKSQLLLQFAQAAARVEGRQQAALPQVAVNVWDSLAGSHAASLPQAAPGPQDLGAARAAAAANDRLISGFNILNIRGQAGYPGYPGSQWGSQWGQHPHLTSSRPADTAALYDTASQHMLLHGSILPASVLGANLSNFSIPRGPGAGLSGLGGDAVGSRSQLLGGARKPRLNNSISLNKQIMNTHSMRDLHTIVRSKGAGFDFFNISSAIARVPKLVGQTGGLQNDATAKALVDDLASLMATHINTFDARGLANSAWAFGKLKYSPSQKLPALIAAAAMDKMEAFSAQNLSNLLWSFVYLHYRNEQLMTAMAKQVIQKVEEFKPQELANVVWAFASMEHYDPDLMDVVGRRALVMVDQFKEQELSNVVWAFAKLHHYDDVLFAHLLGAVTAKLPHFLPQGVSNIAWALATAGHRDDGLFEHLLGHCLSDISSYDVQGLSNLLWACATLGHKDTAFLSAVLQECSCRLDRMSSQNLSNALWACATLGHADSRMLGNWAEAVMHKLDMFEPQGLSNTAWAFAKLGLSSPVLFEAMAEAALGKLDMFTAQGLSNMAWAYATVGHYNPAMAQQLAAQVAKHVGSFNAQNCSVTAWAFSTLRHYHPELFYALLEQLAAQLDAVEPQNIANSLWAFARVGHPLGQHNDALVAAAKRLLPRMNQQELCNTVWALGVLGQLDTHTWEQFCHCAGNVQGLTPEGVHQAFHAQLMLHSKIARNAAVPLSSIPAEQLPTLPEPLQSHARHMWLTSAVDVHVSKLQADVSAALLLVGIPNTMEWLTDDGLFSIDIAFQVDGQPVAVEVDGSHHYTNSAPQMPLSEVLVRRRLLQDRGWKVVNVGYLEWEMLPDNPHTKASALLQAIAQELGPQSNWQQVGTPALGSSAAVADLGLQSQPANSQLFSTFSLDNRLSRGSLDGGVAAAAAAAVAAAVGGEARGGVINRRTSLFGYSNPAGGHGAQQVTGMAYDNESGLGSTGLLGTAGICGAGGAPGASVADATGIYGDWQGMDGGLWGRTATGSYDRAWAADGFGTTRGVQQQLALEAFMSAGALAADASAAAAAPRQMSPEHLAVGGPTSASSRNSSCSSQQADSPSSRDVAAGRATRSLPVSPEVGCSSKSSSCGDAPDQGSSRMAAFTWGDGLGIWKPFSGQQ